MEWGVNFYSLWSSESDVQSSGLVIGTVTATDEFLVLSISWEPGFDIVLLGSSVLEFLTDNGDSLERS